MNSFTVLDAIKLLTELADKDPSALNKQFRLLDETGEVLVMHPLNPLEWDGENNFYFGQVEYDAA